ncbi:MAG: 50S ribosomal protein L3 N(5)-glutamine methyltransferase [Wenzhouxiangellaceae bacterium]
MTANPGSSAGCARRVAGDGKLPGMTDTSAAFATMAPDSVGGWVYLAAQRMEAQGLHFGHGTATAIDEAAWMVSHVLDLPPDFEPLEFRRMLEADARERLDALLEQRIQTRKPLAYLIGEAWFAGLPFVVDESVLVPRSPLGEIVREGLLPWLDFSRPLSVLDVGTGSGCIAVALAAWWPQLSVDACDISEQALSVARRNVERHGVGDRVRLWQADVYDGLPQMRHDLIISNPPYVPEASMTGLPDEYRHEPALGLVAGSDGLAVFRRLLAGAPERLTPGGLLLVELGEAAEAAAALLGDISAIWLEFEQGGEGVVLLDRAACIEFNAR